MKLKPSDLEILRQAADIIRQAARDEGERGRKWLSYWTASYILDAAIKDADSLVNYVRPDSHPFPIQGGDYRNPDGTLRRPVERYPPSFVPWWLAEEAYAEYARQFGNLQSLERLAQRGGFGREELLTLLRRKEWGSQ